MVNDIETLRKSRDSGKVGFYLKILAAVIWVAAALYAASYGNIASAIFALCPVPFLVVSAAQIQQARVNRALLAEIDSLRSERSGMPIKNESGSA